MKLTNLLLFYIIDVAAASRYHLLLLCQKVSFNAFMLQSSIMLEARAAT